jgi:hypothetical protein
MHLRRSIQTEKRRVKVVGVSHAAGSGATESKAPTGPIRLRQHGWGLLIREKRNL